ncbi:MAG: ABC transporter substrate-binding protein [Bacteroidota bacterium]
MNLKNLPLAAVCAAMCLLTLWSCKPDAPEFKRTENIVAIRLVDEPDRLNPILSTQSYARYVFEHIFQNLNDVDQQSYELVPMLASLPEVSEVGEDGATSYRYRLNENAKWPDGSAVTSADVAFSVKALLNPLVPAGRVRSFYTDITDLIIVDERTFSIELGQAYFLTDYALAALYVYPEYAYDPDGLMADVTVAELADADNAARLAEENPNLKTFAEGFQSFETSHEPGKVVGSGAYELTNWEAQQRIALSRRDDYWADGTDNLSLSALPDGLEFEIIPDAQTAVVALQDELIDVMVDLDPERYVEMSQDELMTKKYNFETEPSFQMYSIILNMDDPMLGDANTRRALAHLMNVDLLNEEYYNNMGRRSSNPVLPVRTYYDERLALIDYDQAEAERLLTEAGWADTNGDGTLDRDGEEFELNLLLFNTPIGEAIGQVMRESCRQAGISLNTETMGGRALYGKLGEGDYQMGIYAQGFQPSPDEFSQSYLTTSVPPNGTNRARFGDETSDALINQIRVTVDAEDRVPLYKEMQAIFYQETPMIPLFSPMMRLVYSKRFEAQTSSITPGLDLANFKHLQE